MSDKIKEPKAEEKPVEKAEEAPKWAIELSAKFEKMADAFLKMAESKQEEPEEEEEKPKEEEKQEEEEEKPEEEPKEEEKQEEDEEKPEEEEEDMDKKIEDAVTKAVKKALTVESDKKSKVPKDDELNDALDYAKISKMSWEDVNKEAQKRGAK